MVRKKNHKLEGKVAGFMGSVSGTGSIISSYNVCHNICLGVVALLSVFGIVVSSNILMFLQDFRMLFWSTGILLLGLSLFLYKKFGKCISLKLIVFNAGLLTIGMPFETGSFIVLFWVIGGLIVISSIGWFVKDRMIR